MSQQLAPNIVRNLGLELPVFDEIHMVYGGLHRSMIPNLDSFGRNIGLSYIAQDLRLNQVFDIAKIEFQKINDITQTQTVPHEYGLIREEDFLESLTGPMFNGRHDDVPGYRLVAKVDRLITEPWTYKDARLDIIETGARQYTNQHPVIWRLGDISLKQFILGRRPEAVETDAFLTDVDLWIYNK